MLPRAKRIKGEKGREVMLPLLNAKGMKAFKVKECRKRGEDAEEA